MTTFDERELGFEGKYAHDQEIAFKVTARRNRMLARWAGGLMEMQGKPLDEYVSAIVSSEFTEHGDEDVLHKVLNDLACAGLKTTEQQVRRQMDRFQTMARGQIQGS